MMEVADRLRQAIRSCLAYGQATLAPLRGRRKSPADLIEKQSFREANPCPHSSSSAARRRNPARRRPCVPILKALLLPTLAEEGCLHYEMNESEDGQSWVFTELWESRQHWDRHMHSQQFHRLRAAAPEMAEYWDLFEGHIVRPGT